MKHKSDNESKFPFLPSEKNQSAGLFGRKCQIKARLKELVSADRRGKTRLKPSCLSFLKWGVPKRHFAQAEMLHTILIREGEDSTIAGIIKPPFLSGPDPPRGLHFRKWMFLLNTLKWSQGKGFSLLSKEKLSRIYPGLYFRVLKFLLCARPSTGG